MKKKLFILQNNENKFIFLKFLTKNEKKTFYSS